MLNFSAWSAAEDSHWKSFEDNYYCRMQEQHKEGRTLSDPITAAMWVQTSSELRTHVFHGSLDLHDKTTAFPSQQHSIQCTTTAHAHGYTRGQFPVREL